MRRLGSCTEQSSGVLRLKLHSAGSSGGRSWIFGPGACTRRLGPDSYPGHSNQSTDGLQRHGEAQARRGCLSVPPAEGAGRELANTIPASQIVPYPPYHEALDPARQLDAPGDYRPAPGCPEWAVTFSFFRRLPTVETTSMVNSPKVTISPIVGILPSRW